MHKLTWERGSPSTPPTSLPPGSGGRWGESFDSPHQPPSWEWRKMGGVLRLPPPASLPGVEEDGGTTSLPPGSGGRWGDHQPPSREWRKMGGVLRLPPPASLHPRVPPPTYNAVKHTSNDKAHRRICHYCLFKAPWLVFFISFELY